MPLEVTKKFVNNPSEIVDDALKGLTDYNPKVVLLKNCPRVVIRRNLAVDIEKISLIAGGGSGHEPFSAGYVGRGMLTAAIAGNVFASPPSSQIQAALEGTKTNDLVFCTFTNEQTLAGSILFVINYTGDRLNFGLAAERFKAMGNDVRIVTIADDIAIDVTKSRAGSRGLAGSVLVLKIAGAMSEKGWNLDEIEETSLEVCKNIRTIGCSLGPCSIPGKGPMFNMAANLYEVGLGIHGEAGKERVEMETASQIVNRLMKELVKGKEKDIPQAILLNNLGSVSQIEMDVLKGEILAWCAKQGLNPVRFYCGSYMTSLDNHGISITTLNIVNQRWLELLDAKADCPGWEMGTKLEPNLSPALKTDKSTFKRQETKPAVEVGTEIPKLKATLLEVCKEMRKRENELNDLDGAAGDGDCGSTFKCAADAIGQKLQKQELCLSDVQRCLEQVAVVFENNVGGTSGAIYALFLSVFAQSVKEVSSQSVAEGLRLATEAVEKYGGARRGDRTMIDTLRSAIEACGGNKTVDWGTVVKAAEEGAMETAKMRAAAGRASYTSAEVQTKPDAGAKAMAYWMRSIWNQFT